MTTILNVLFPVLLALTSPAPQPASTTTTAAAASTSTVNNCYCQTKPGKDWGK